MSICRVFHTDLLSGTTFGQLPVSSASYTEIISAPGSFEVVIPVRAAEVANIAPDMIAEGRTGIWIERNGVLMFGGILWTQQVDPENNYITIAGEGFHSYVRQRYIHDTLIFTQVEQQSIATQILTYIAGFPYGDVGITVPSNLAQTVLRDRTYNAYEIKQAGDSIEQLAAVQDGFDFRYLPYRDDNNRMRVQFTPQFPSTGRPTPYQFILGANCRVLTEQTDGKQIATKAYAVGGGEGSSLPIASATATSLGAWPLIEQVDSFSDISDIPTLQSKAALRVSQNGRPVRLPSIEVDPDADPPIGAIAPGDLVRVYGKYGLLQVDDHYKIQQVTYTANSDEGENVTVELAQIGVFQDGD